ncbi:hypothetical protein ACFQAT_06980 [Undibacterium arcticum]|uniref:hypothetical protein n=1 Tax=Undibacterium arcticum TaxID=1762892 RepID=UPI00360C5148
MLRSVAAVARAQKAWAGLRDKKHTAISKFLSPINSRDAAAIFTHTPAIRRKLKPQQGLFLMLVVQGTKPVRHACDQQL